MTIPAPVNAIVLPLQYVLQCAKFLETPTKRSYFSYVLTWTNRVNLHRPLAPFTFSSG